jgi:hypothetical protein
MSLTWYRPGHLFQTINQPVEGRAMQFFCEKAGPLLSGPLDSYFWTHLVMQFSNFEPAVRHAVVAISSLYEDFHYKGRTTNQLQANDFALRHYNAAIESLRRIDSEPLVLLVCVLFVCIEILQNNREAAIEHSGHGVIILKRIGFSYPWTKEYLTPIFRRLSVFPLFFGKSPDASTEPEGLDEPIPDMFTTFAEAQYFLDAIVCRAAFLARRGDAYRYGTLYKKPVPPHQLAAQIDVQNALTSWRANLYELERKLELSDNDGAYCNLIMRYNVSRVWADMAFTAEEVLYDSYIENFRTIVERATALGPIMIGSDTVGKPKFSFEIGFLPFLIFTIMKCRDLATRIDGLTLIQMYGVTRENLWEADKMFPICKRLVEVEHDIILDDLCRPCGPVSWDYVPPEEMRAKDFASNPEPTLQMDANGNEIEGFLANFLMRTSEGDVWIQREFVPTPGPILPETILGDID